MTVAVRSSAADEDTAHASAAGQYETVLGVRGAAAVTKAVRTCWASAHSDRAVAYRDGAAAAPMAVIVQRLVEADVSGVLFTGDDVVIEASWGLGAGVVGGTVTPDAYRVGADGVVTRAATHQRGRPVLDDGTANALARLGRRVEALLGGPQDVEWAIAGGELWLLQARPVTVAPPPPAPAATVAALTGTPASRGVATGPARVIDGPDGFGRVRAGDMLVCRFTDPAWTPLLRVAAGVVTETGGALSHAAIVARERRIPAVVGVDGATTRIRDGATITVDGAAGTVTTEE
ncbi:PEP/pyruvate-binding domain-containing protein [Jiangella anatolica]|uniref:Pyruvate, phosphate dikinase n=1 Tax=Jiangella anatolica TaxID=2670374 RepID=A0A2W2B2Q3_9ACTN|nr:PEP/pyruvate-binding domain-containing protein [Jiangella anatolica]PZF80292.1 pyruvate, phosphate dikinase [Jiangella anatolica]